MRADADSLRRAIRDIAVPWHEPGTGGEYERLREALGEQHSGAA